MAAEFQRSIRLANRYDIPRLMELVESYGLKNPISALSNPANHDFKYLEQLLLEIIMGRGFILIDQSMNGCIIAMKSRNIWCPKVWELRELVWWVEPEHRNTTIGGRLWFEFERMAREMLAEKKIDYICTSITAGGPFIDYTKRGYKPLDATFFRDQ